MNDEPVLTATSHVPGADVEDSFLLVLTERLDTGVLGQPLVRSCASMTRMPLGPRT